VSPPTPDSRLASGACFAAGVVVVFIACAAIYVYGLRQFAWIKGPDTTFQIFAWLSLIPGAVGALAYMFGAKLWGIRPRRFPSFVAGGVIAALFWLVSAAVEYLPETFAVVTIWVLLLAGSLFAARAIRLR